MCEDLDETLCAKCGRADCICENEDEMRKLFEPRRDYKGIIDEAVFRIIANVGNYFIVVPIEDEDTPTYIYIPSALST